MSPQIRRICAILRRRQDHACHWAHPVDLSDACRQELLQRAVQLAREAGAKVALDLASFEVVREFRADVEALIESKHIDCCFCNEVRCSWSAICDVWAPITLCRRCLQSHLCLLQTPVPCTICHLWAGLLRI